MQRGRQGFKGKCDFAEERSTGQKVKRQGPATAHKDRGRVDKIRGTRMKRNDERQARSSDETQYRKKQRRMRQKSDGEIIRRAREMAKS
jgi:hypothetical protein